MARSVSPHFTSRHCRCVRYAAFGAVLLVAGCAGDAGPRGGVKPELASVPDVAAPRYDAYERAVLAESLEASAAATREEAAIADARIAGEQAPESDALVPRVVEPPPPPRERRRAEEIDLDEDLVGARGIVRLADAVRRDRAELARLTAVLDDIERPPPVPPERIAVVAFAPGSNELDPFEQQRLALAVSSADPVAEWLVRAGGAAGPERAAAAVAALESLGIERSTIITIDSGRDVAVAEIAVRR